MEVANLSRFTMDLFSKDTTILIKELKSIIPQSLLYFSDILNITEFTQEKIDNVCETLQKEGYEFYFKIEAILKILIVADYSQTNKFNYEECMEHLNTSTRYLTIWNDFKTLKNDLYIAKNENLIKSTHHNILDLNTYIQEYSRLIGEKKVLLINESINMIKNNLNHIILNITIINRIIKKIE